MHAGRIDIHTRQEKNIWDSKRGNPTQLFEQHTVDAIHLCLYACHTVLQPIFDERHSGDNMIKTCTAEGMQKWVQNNFHWLRDVCIAKYGHRELAQPIRLDDKNRLCTLIETVMQEAGKGKTSSWRQWFNGFLLDASDVIVLADEALRLLVTQVFEEETNTPLAERAMPFADRKYAQQDNDLPYKKQRARTEASTSTSWQRPPSDWSSGWQEPQRACSSTWETRQQGRRTSYPW
jgi:hypothetical protein